MLLLITVGFAGYFYARGPIPQDRDYHQFADARNLWGIPNFWNVASNLPMLFLGAYGLNLSAQNFSIRPGFAAKWMPVVLAFGIFITSFGSAYYHYNPDNQTLVWDRLPMTLMFMAVFSMVVYDFDSPKAGSIVFAVSVPAGLLSIAWWQWTEAAGTGDLRPYGFVQFFPMLAAPVIILSSSKKLPYAGYFWFVLLWYVVAKVLEHFDKAVFSSLGFWSGHTLKHLTGAIALYYLIRLMAERERLYQTG